MVGTAGARAQGFKKRLVAQRLNCDLTFHCGDNGASML